MNATTLKYQITRNSHESRSAIRSRWDSGIFPFMKNLIEEENRKNSIHRIAILRIKMKANQLKEENRIAIMRIDQVLKNPKPQPLIDLKKVGGLWFFRLGRFGGSCYMKTNHATRTIDRVVLNTAIMGIAVLLLSAVFSAN